MPSEQGWYSSPVSRAGAHLHESPRSRNAPVRTKQRGYGVQSGTISAISFCFYLSRQWPPHDLAGTSKNLLPSYLNGLGPDQLRSCLCESERVSFCRRAECQTCSPHVNIHNVGGYPALPLVRSQHTSSLRLAIRRWAEGRRRGTEMCHVSCSLLLSH
jgi:hypothetical protein